MIVFFPEDIFSEYVQLGSSVATIVSFQGPGLLHWTCLATISLFAGSCLKKINLNQIKTRWKKKIVLMRIAVVA